MKEPIFIQTSRGDRTNILANFKLLSKESFIQSVKESKSGQYRYGYLDGTVDNLTAMRLEEFEQVFPEQPFTQEEITREFRKEISEKYGTHAIKEAFLKKFERGGVYLNKYGQKYAYLGKVRKSFTKYGKKEVTEGNGFCYLYSEPFVIRAGSVEVLKTFMTNIREKIGEISLEKEYSQAHSSYYGNGSLTEIELL